jgi:acyl-CoA carboxylase epsilon subunit
VSGANQLGSASEQPLLRVVRGTPDDVELAALTAVVGALAAATPEPDTRPEPSRWGAPQLRQPLHPGPGAWRFSAR